MSTEQVVVVALLAGAASALVLARVVWRAASRASAALWTAQERADAHAATIADKMTQARSALIALDTSTEKTLWTLATLDSRVDKATADLTAKRVASDRLRVRLVQGQMNIARLRQLAQLLLRLSELRREFL
jgi:hypothetical protein